MRSDRWEVGSDFHWDPGSSSEPTQWPWRDARLYGSGRSALAALVLHGKFQRVWVPAYYFPGVCEALTGVEIRAYSARPDRPILLPSAGPDDLLVVANLLGVQEGPDLPRETRIVEDHTHDLRSSWAFSSEADWAFASLRKTLPVPDGGILWSPKGRALPPELAVTAEHAKAALHRLSAMLRKARYLEGADPDKPGFLTEAVAGERSIGRRISGATELTKSMLSTIPADRWRAKRAENLGILSTMLPMRPLDARSGGVPLGACLVFADQSTRDQLRESLIVQQVYPAVLWPLEDSAWTDAEARSFSARSLLVHCDHRYVASEMERVGRVVTDALAGLRA
jgi:hypothetical protein